MEGARVSTFSSRLSWQGVNDVDFVMLDADVAGCVVTFLSGRNLNLYQTAILGLCYRNLTKLIPTFDEEGKAYYHRLELLAELVLKAVARSNKKYHERR